MYALDIEPEACKLDGVARGPQRARRPGEKGSAMGRSGLEAQVIIDDEGLHRLLPEWWGLWSRLENATPFGAPAWLLPWWRTFRPGPLLTVAVRQHGRLVGLAPAYVEQGPFGRRLLPIGIGVSDYLDVLIDPAVADVGAALVDETLRHADRWDSWELEELSPGAAALELAIEGPEVRSRRQSPCPVLPLPSLAGWPRSRAGRRWRRAWNRVERFSRVAVVAAEAETVPALLDWLIALHARRWSKAGQSGVLAAPAVQAFHREAAPRLLDAGLLQLFALTVEGQTVGAYYGFLHGPRAYGYLSGFDPDWSSQSPGTALLGHAMREATVRGCTEFHFLRGQEAYKYAWGAVDRWNHGLTVRADLRVEDDAPAGTVRASESAAPAPP